MRKLGKLIIAILFISITKLNAQVSDLNYQKELVGKWQVQKTKTFGKVEDIEMTCSDCAKITFQNNNKIFIENSEKTKEEYSWKVNGNKINFINDAYKKQFPTFQMEYEIKIIETSPTEIIEFFNKEGSITLIRI